MIKINLLGDDTVIDTSGTWLAIGYVLSVVVTVLVGLLLNYATSSFIEEMTIESANLETELSKLKETTREVHDLELKKKELSDKTNVIGTLKKSKYGPVRILDDLNNALPDRAWITSVKESGGQMNIAGYALDNQTIASFMKALQASTYFENVDLGESKEVEREGAKIKEFTLITKVAYAGGVAKGDVSTSLIPDTSASPAVSASASSTASATK